MSNEYHLEGDHILVNGKELNAEMILKHIVAIQDVRQDTEQEYKQLKQQLSRHVIYSQILHKALANVSKCPESDLTKYCMSVDGIVTEALCRHEDPEIELLREIQADAVRGAASAVFNQFNKWGKAQIFLNEYADKLESGEL